MHKYKIFWSKKTTINEQNINCLQCTYNECLQYSSNTNIQIVKFWNYKSGGDPEYIHFIILLHFKDKVNYWTLF